MKPTITDVQKTYTNVNVFTGYQYLKKYVKKNHIFIWSEIRLYKRTNLKEIEDGLIKRIIQDY